MLPISTQIWKIAKQLGPELRAILLARAKELLAEQGTQGNDLPIIEAGTPPPAGIKVAGGTYIVHKMIPKRTKAGVKYYGPYAYKYRWDSARKKSVFVSYEGKVS